MSKPSPIVHIVDDDEFVRTALGNLLSAAGYEVRTYNSGTEFFLSASKEKLGCIVLDVLMPGPSGLDLHETLTHSGNALPVIFLSGHGDIPMSVSAMKAGAVDFLTKPVDRVKLLNAIKEALARSAGAASANAELKILQLRFATLTARELHVFRGVVVGLLNKQIAAGLGTSERTVKIHRAHLMDKMQAKSLAELVRMASMLELPASGATPPAS